MSEQIIPARMNVRRDAVDSVFLENYARRLQGRAKWLAALYTIWGAMLGFALGTTAVGIYAWAQMIKGAGINLATLLGHQPAAVIDPTIFGISVYWVPFAAAAIMAVLLGGRGVGKSDELRFQAQMALHLIRLQDLVKEHVGS